MQENMVSIPADRVPRSGCSWRVLPDGATNGGRDHPAKRFGETGLPRRRLSCYFPTVRITFFLLAVFLPLTSFAGTFTPTKAELKRFDKADTSNDELISPTEFSALMKVLTKAKQGGAGNVAELQEVADTFFDWFDSNNDNAIDLSEWYFARTSSPTDAGLPEVKTLFGIDLNGDETVKVGEFVKVLKELIPAKFAVAWFKSLTA
jgi:Ca2+-binding EF-hand superfamily protein